MSTLESLPNQSDDVENEIYFLYLYGVWLKKYSVYVDFIQ